LGRLNGLVVLFEWTRKCPRKEILIAKPVGRRRRRERPKLRWEDGVNNDVKAVRERNRNI
jgi:hypothetical protein